MHFRVESACFFSRKAASKEIKCVEKFLYKESLLGEYFRTVPILIIQLIQAHKDVEITAEDATNYYLRVAETSVMDKPRSFV